MFHCLSSSFGGDASFFAGELLLMQAAVNTGSIKVATTSSMDNLFMSSLLSVQGRPATNTPRRRCFKHSYGEILQGGCIFGSVNRSVKDKKGIRLCRILLS